eukprot:COSAG02_NODE_50559_length_319_cov_3.913636_1_plen_55_part_10
MARARCGERARGCGSHILVWRQSWWDEGDGEAKDTRRPGITAFNPRTRRWYVLDI